MTLSETINRMMETILESAEFTSANPTHINRLIQINTLENPDLEKEIEEKVKEITPADRLAKLIKEEEQRLEKMKKQLEEHFQELLANPTPKRRQKLDLKVAMMREALADNHKMMEKERSKHDRK